MINLINLEMWNPALFLSLGTLPYEHAKFNKFRDRESCPIAVLNTVPYISGHDGIPSPVTGLNNVPYISGHGPCSVYYRDKICSVHFGTWNPALCITVLNTVPYISGHGTLLCILPC
jgi:hypothetical protein